MLALAKDIAHQARGRRGKKEQHEVLTGTATTTSVGRASPWGWSRRGREEWKSSGLPSYVQPPPESVGLMAAAGRGGKKSAWRLREMRPPATGWLVAPQERTSQELGWSQARRCAQGGAGPRWGWLGQTGPGNAAGVLTSSGVCSHTVRRSGLRG